MVLTRQEKWACQTRIIDGKKAPSDHKIPAPEKIK
jgi:hypothetical protein